MILLNQVFVFNFLVYEFSFYMSFVDNAYIYDFKSMIILNPSSRISMVKYFYIILVHPLLFVPYKYQLKTLFKNEKNINMQKLKFKVMYKTLVFRDYFPH